MPGSSANIPQFEGPAIVGDSEGDETRDPAEMTEVMTKKEPHIRAAPLRHYVPPRVWRVSVSTQPESGVCAPFVPRPVPPSSFKADAGSRSFHRIKPR